MISRAPASRSELATWVAQACCGTFWVAARQLRVAVWQFGRCSGVPQDQERACGIGRVHEAKMEISSGRSPKDCGKVEDTLKWICAHRLTSPRSHPASTGQQHSRLLSLMFPSQLDAALQKFLGFASITEARELRGRLKIVVALSFNSAEGGYSYLFELSTEAVQSTLIRNNTAHP